MLREVDAIAHLARMNASMGRKPEMRQAFLERMNELSKALSQLSNELGSTRTIDRLSLEKKMGDLTIFYSDAFEKGTVECTATKVDKIAQCIQKDISALSVAPIKKPNLGINGPTFLVNYARPSEEASFCSFVVKKTDFAEIIPNQIYREFAYCCEQETGKKIFGSPDIAAIDFSAKLYLNPLRESVALQTEELTSLRTSFATLGKSMKAKLDSPQIIMLAEKVEGQNVFDFLTSERYVTASPEQKGAFFFKAGMISLLDLVIGNFDRFISIDPDKPGFLSKKNPANFGNAFILSDGDATSGRCFDLVAIDNGIDSKLTINADPRLEWSCKEVRDQYSLFLQKIISNAEGIELLVMNIIQAFKIYPTVLKAPTGLLDPFLNDLKNPEICHSKLREGLLAMGSLIKKVIIPYWNSSRSANLKAEINQKFGGALNPLDERLAVFNKSFLALEEMLSS